MSTSQATSAPERQTTAIRWLAPAILAWALLYGSLRAYWAMGNAPRFSPMPTDLLLYSPWASVGLCAAAALAVLALRFTTARRDVLVLSWAVVAAILIACPMFLLDVVGGVLAGLGIPIDLVSSGSRATMMTGAVLLAVATRSYQRQMRGGCRRCGRTPGWVRDERTPIWAWFGAYLAVAGCVVRVVAQLVVGFGDFIYQAGASLIVFEVGFILAGTLLPLALVHRFGVIWPAWVLPLAGRRVPRWLVLAPGLFLGGMLTLYFGFGMAHLVSELVSGDADYGDGVNSAGFMWTSVPAYFVWGVGLGLAAIARFRATRPVCRICGR